MAILEFDHGKSVKLGGFQTQTDHFQTVGFSAQDPLRRG